MFSIDYDYDYEHEHEHEHDDEHELELEKGTSLYPEKNIILGTTQQTI